MGKNEEIESALKRYEKGERPQQNDSYYLNELAKEGSSRGNAWRDYKAGKRKNPIMAAQVEALSKQDMSDLAAWFGAQQGLYVKR